MTYFFTAKLTTYFKTQLFIVHTTVSVHIKTVSSYLVPVVYFNLNQLKLVYGLFGQSKIHSTLDFCPRPARKETNDPLHKRSLELTALK